MKYKLSRIEIQMLNLMQKYYLDDYKFSEIDVLCVMKDNGYYKDVPYSISLKELSENHYF